MRFDYSYVTVKLTNGKKYRITCLHIERIGDTVFCDLLETNDLGAGLLFMNKRMYFYYKRCPHESCGSLKILNIPFVGSFCVKEIFDIKGEIAKHYYEEVS